MTFRRHSVSATHLYEECPAAYNYRYHLKPETIEDDAEHLRIGKAIHAGFEGGHIAFRDQGLSGSLSQVNEAAIAALEQEWVEEGLGDNDVGLDVATDALVETLATRTADAADLIGIEFEFNLHTPAATPIVGYADLIQRVDATTIEILDWKTGAKPKSLDDVYRATQLNLYAWASTRVFPWVETIFIGEIYPMLDALSVRVEASPVHMDFAVARIDADAEMAQTETQWPTVVDHHCRWCPYRHICPALEGLPADQVEM